MEIWIHENNAYRINEVISFWAEKLQCPEGYFTRVYYKKHKVKTNRRNVGEAYHGLVRVRVKKSSTLVRKITGWTKGIHIWGIV